MAGRRDWRPNRDNSLGIFGSLRGAVPFRRLFPIPCSLFPAVPPYDRQAHVLQASVSG
jgi:hypothetical protein